MSHTGHQGGHDPQLLQEAKQAFGVRTTKDAIGVALREAVVRRRQLAATEMIAALDLDVSLNASRTNDLVQRYEPGPVGFAGRVSGLPIDSNVEARISTSAPVAAAFAEILDAAPANEIVTSPPFAVGLRFSPRSPAFGPTSDH